MGAIRGSLVREIYNYPHSKAREEIVSILGEQQVYITNHHIQFSKKNVAAYIN